MDFFDNAGNKLKTLINVLFILFVVIFAIIGIAMMVDDSFFAGLVFIVLAALFTWIGFLALAAFSELVIANNYQASKLNELSEKLDKLTKTE